MFAEKQKLVADLEVYGAGHGGGAAPAPAAPAEAPAGQALSSISNLWPKVSHVDKLSQYSLKCSINEFWCSEAPAEAPAAEAAPPAEETPAA